MDALKPKERLLGPALRTQPDRRLVALARDGNTPAQEEIVRRYRAALVRYAGSIVGAAAAEDVVQESLTKGMAALGRADEELRLRAWLYAIVRNTGLNHLRDASPATEQLDENYDGVEQPPQALERRERVRSLVDGVRRLPHQQREALVKRELEGRSHDEIGAELGVSSGAARQLIFRAREALRVGFGSLLPMPLLRWLAESGGGDAAVGVAAGAGGGALAAKAAVAVFAAGAAVTAGVAIDHGAKQRPVAPPAAEAAVRPVLSAPSGAGAAAAPVVVTTAEDSRHRHGSGSSGDGKRDSSGPGSAEEQGGDGGGHSGGGPGPSEHSGPGSSGDSDDRSDDSGGHGERSGRGGSEDSSGEDRSGSSHGGRSGSGGGDDRSGSNSGSGSSHGGSGGSGGSGSGSGRDSGSSGGSDDFGESHSGGGSSGSGSSGGSGDGVEAVTVPTPSPAPAPEPAPEESSSGSGSSGGGGSSEDSSEDSRDLSGSVVSQGSDDPN
jgi:RNA polymerase sigma factor (sigma-70 family)